MADKLDIKAFLDKDEQKDLLRLLWQVRGEWQPILLMR